MTSQSCEVLLDSCEAITRASYPSLMLRGGLRAPIVRGGGVVCGEGMELGMGKPTVFNISGFDQKNYIRPPISRLYEESAHGQPKGKLKHYCYEWDGMAIDETCQEFDACLCFKR